MLASLFVLCAVIGLFISNTATAVLMAPSRWGRPIRWGLALSLCHDHRHRRLGSLHDAGLVAGQHPGAGPGNYKFMDFVRIGVPFTLLVMVVSVIAIPGSSRSDDSKRYGGLRAAFYCPQCSAR